MLTVYGTVTSPFVRRVRIVADELGVASTLLDVNDPAVQADFRARSPIWKVPVATWGDELLLDSHTITELLMARRGPGPLQPFDPLDVGARNAIAVADGAADALINAFYLARDGVDAGQSAYLRKQQERAAAALAWLDARVDGPCVRTTPAAATEGPIGPIGLVEIALFTALSWMAFRATYPIERHANLTRFLAIHAERPSFAATRPA